MFQKKKPGQHGFFCCCQGCKTKRKTSLFYMGFLLAFLIILIYQCIFTIFIVTRFNAFLCFLFLMVVLIGFVRIIF